MMFESPVLTNYLYLLIEYLGYSNLAMIAVGLYIMYYLLSNTFMFIMFLFIGIVIGIYIGNTNYMKLM